MYFRTDIVLILAKNTLDTNEPKAKRKRKAKKQESSEKTGSAYPAFIVKIAKFLRDERTHKVVGSLLILLSVYLFLACVSYLFTWKADQNIVYGKSLWELITSSKEITVNNWLGKFGAGLSHIMIFKWFGLASFLIVLNLFVVGVKIISGYALLPIKKMVGISAISMVWTSIFLGYLAGASTRFLGGAFGYHITEWMAASLGGIGAFFLIACSAFIIVVVLFNPNFTALWNKFFSSDNAIEGDNNDDKYVVDEAQGDIRIVNTIDEDEIKEDVVSQTVDFDEDAEEENNDSSDEEESSEPEEESTEDEELEIVANSEEENKEEEESTEDDDDFSIEVAKTDDEQMTEDLIKSKVEEFGEFDPTLELGAYALPPTELLVKYGSDDIQINKEELEKNKNNIVDTLANYKIEISKIKATIGPTVTLYEIIPAAGVRISKIKNLEDDIALSLAALGIRIIAPIPGKGTIGIEVPNSSPDTVSMRTLISSEKFQNSDMELPVALGKTIANETFIYDLVKMPHLLMAGATGQGKSVGLNAILVSILYKKHPSQVKFVLVDPKKVELTLFNKIERHFLAKLPGEEEPIITDTTKVVNTVNSLCIEMDERYELLKNAHCRNIKEYNKKFIGRRLNPEEGHRYLPYIVLVIDEFADLIMTAGKEIETPIARLAQLARAIGIHLIVATQRPSVNIITGTIKANFPARIAFRVTSKIDSRTILDAGGADQLIGRGDMLMSTGNDLIRLQCGFVDTPEVEKICDFIGSQKAYPDAHMLPEYIGEEGDGPGDFDMDDRDSLFEDAAGIIVTHQQGSASLLQRKLKIGYNRAGRIIDQLEAAGIIGPFKGSKAREVLIPDQLSLEQFLNNGSSNTENE